MHLGTFNIGGRVEIKSPSKGMKSFFEENFYGPDKPNLDSLDIISVSNQKLYLMEKSKLRDFFWILSQSNYKIYVD